MLFSSAECFFSFDIPHFNSYIADCSIPTAKCPCLYAPGQILEPEWASWPWWNDEISLTPVPPSLGTADGFFNKTNKAALLHFFTDYNQEDISYPKCSLNIQDVNALFHVLTNIAPTFGEICLQVLDQMVAKKDFIFSTDSYHADSIKAQERLRRGSSQCYLIQEPATRKPSDFKLFLENEQNKTQLCELLLKVWSRNAAASRMDQCGTVLVIVDGKLQSSDGEVSNWIAYVNLL